MPNHLEIVTRAYLEACVFADAPESTNPRLTKQARHAAKSVCVDFLKQVQIDALPSDYSLDQLGHDLWLTSQGHGVGFWDRHELHGSLRDYLTKLSKNYKRVYPEFVRGWVYLSGTDGSV